MENRKYLWPALALAFAIPAHAGNGAPHGAHYNVNVIGVPKGELTNFLGGGADGSNGSSIFMPLVTSKAPRNFDGATCTTPDGTQTDFVDEVGPTYSTQAPSGKDRIYFDPNTDGVFAITDRDAVDGEARISIPIDPTDGNRVLVDLYVRVLGKPGLAGVRVAVQGVGHVGEKLCALLSAEGADLIVADVDTAAAARVARRYAARVTSSEEILAVDADILAPCALGGILNDVSIPKLKVGAVCGAANNQLAEERHDRALHERGILFAPDFVVNDGGAINGVFEGPGYDRAQVWQHVGRIYERCLDIFARADKDGVTSLQAAEAIARELLAR